MYELKIEVDIRGSRRYDRRFDDRPRDEFRSSESHLTRLNDGFRCITIAWISDLCFAIANAGLIMMIFTNCTCRDTARLATDSPCTRDVSLLAIKMFKTDAANFDPDNAIGKTELIETNSK